MSMVIGGIASVAISIVAFVVVTRAWTRFLDRRDDRSLRDLGTCATESATFAPDQPTPRIESGAS